MCSQNLTITAPESAVLQRQYDEVFEDYAKMSRSLARDAARIIELGRANEVSCLFVWNTSGLDNFRPAAARTFDWPEPQSAWPRLFCPAGGAPGFLPGSWDRKGREARHR